MREAMYDVKSEKPFLSDTLGKVCKGLILMSQSSGKVEILYRQLLHGILVARSIGNSSRYELKSVSKFFLPGKVNA